MSVLYPHFDFHRIYEIPVSFWKDRGITALLLDVDNTLTTHNNPRPHEQILDWLANQQEAGLRVMILSNNRQERVAPFAARLGLEYIASAAKPLPGRLRRALAALGVSPKETALVGDQIFTDVLCGRLTGCLSVLVEPMEPESGRLFRFKRGLEKGILRRYRKTKEKNSR